MHTQQITVKKEKRGLRYDMPQGMSGAALMNWKRKNAAFLRAVKENSFTDVFTVPNIPTPDGTNDDVMVSICESVAVCNNAAFPNGNKSGTRKNSESFIQCAPRDILTLEAVVNAYDAAGIVQPEPVLCLYMEYRRVYMLCVKTLNAAQNGN